MMRQLTTVGPSKIIITTTAMPTSLSGEFGGPLAGVQHQLLPGLTQADTIRLLRRLGVRGSRSSVKNLLWLFRLSSATRGNRGPQNSHVPP